jgi:hypothetical protein
MSFTVMYNPTLIHCKEGCGGVLALDCFTTCFLTADTGFVYRACGLGCPQTCDNYKRLKEDPSSCDLSQVDGCFCPDGQVSVL